MEPEELALCVSKKEGEVSDSLFLNLMFQLLAATTI